MHEKLSDDLGGYDCGVVAEGSWCAGSLVNFEGLADPERQRCLGCTCSDSQQLILIDSHGCLVGLSDCVNGNRCNVSLMLFSFYL